MEHKDVGNVTDGIQQEGSSNSWKAGRYFALLEKYGAWADLVQNGRLDHV